MNNSQTYKDLSIRQEKVETRDCVNLKLKKMNLYLVRLASFNFFL
jgi:hypothetical protein